MPAAAGIIQVLSLKVPYVAWRQVVNYYTIYTQSTKLEFLKMKTKGTYE